MVRESKRGRPRSREIAIATEGQRLLVARPEGVSELARLVGVVEQRIDDWRSGRRKPSSASARQIQAALAIPIAAWARVPSGPELVPLEASPARKPTSLEEVEEMLASLRQTVGLTEKEAQKRIAERVRLLGLKAKIEYQEKLAEDAIVRAHPHWAQIKVAIRTALGPFPDALAALHAALAAIGAWEAAVGELERETGDEAAS